MKKVTLAILIATGICCQAHAENCDGALTGDQVSTSNLVEIANPSARVRVGEEDMNAIEKIKFGNINGQDRAMFSASLLQDHNALLQLENDIRGMLINVERIQGDTIRVPRISYGIFHRIVTRLLADKKYRIPTVARVDLSLNITSEIYQSFEDSMIMRPGFSVTSLGGAGDRRRISRYRTMLPQITEGVILSGFDSNWNYTDRFGNVRIRVLRGSGAFKEVAELLSLAGDSSINSPILQVNDPAEFARIVQKALAVVQAHKAIIDELINRIPQAPR